MTVHSMPLPEDALALGARRTVSGRWKMLLVLLVCAAPVVASYFTYYVVRPEGRRNFGQLIDPQRTMPDLLAQSLAGEPAPLSALKGQWLLVSVGGGQCEALCARHLYIQRQLRESLGKDKDRLDWVWLISDNQPVPESLRPAVSQATVLRMPAATIQTWLQPSADHELAEHLYVVDPMGNWMMRFPANLDDTGAAKAKSDLGRLMRASAFWDKPGRAANDQTQE